MTKTEEDEYGGSATFEVYTAFCGEDITSRIYGGGDPFLTMEKAKQQNLEICPDCLIKWQEKEQKE